LLDDAKRVLTTGSVPGMRAVIIRHRALNGSFESESP
jgi:hypothetical protein